MSRQVHVRPHRRQQSFSRRREAVTRFHGVHDEGKQYYIKGVDPQGHVAAGTLWASSEQDARNEYRSLYPNHKIVQLNERE